MPLDWEELPSLGGPDAWTIANALEHLESRQADPWADLAQAKQSLAAAMKTLGYTPAD